MRKKTIIGTIDLNAEEEFVIRRALKKGAKLFRKLKTIIH